MRKLLLCSLITLFSITVNAQSPGDTIVVQSWDYASANRDTMVDFSSIAGKNIERVILRYAMRCKGAQVSTGANRNLGCGEWDYSCNTYVHNPNKADSINRTIAQYSITPNTNPDSIYSVVPTYEYRPILQQRAVVSSIINEDTAQIGPRTNWDTTIIKSGVRNGKTLIHYTAAELLSNGLVAGNIDALSFQSRTNTAVNIDFLKVGIKHSATNPLGAIDTTLLNSYQNVYNQNTTFNMGENRLQFHSPFTWNGTSDILIELTYQGKASNAALDLGVMSGTNYIYSYNDKSLNLFPSNYVQANSYLGVSGTNSRTVEAWIKTTSGGEITSWGANSRGAKQTFRVVNSSGYLRLEINSGYIEGSTPVNDGKWHHVAYTFSGVVIGQVKLYVDGVRDNYSSISNILMSTGSSLPFQVSKGFHNRYFNGQVDNIRIWDAELSGTVLSDWSRRSLNNVVPHPNASNLELNYSIASGSSNILDGSGNGNHATFNSTNSFYEIDKEDLFKEFSGAYFKCAATFYQGTYNQTVVNDTIIDTIPLPHYMVEERSIFPRPGSTLSDSIIRQTSNYYPKNSITYDLAGNVASQSLSPQVDTLVNRNLSYLQRNPQKVEIMSFVTPYGINLDLGVDGEAWYFDISDFLPVLEGNRRMTMERGGQWQEEMDLQFLFIVGTPPADIKEIHQIWRVDQRNNASILNNSYYEPRRLKIDTSARRYKIRSAITGHGQQGEFMPQMHTIIANNNNFTRSVWMECAENPVYPQGGTWIYDRAGWCPGMATDVAEFDITNLISSDSVDLDYTMSTAPGDSRYIVSNQLVQYGPANFTHDARIEKVLRPTNQTEFGRRNPTCYNPIVILKNTGSTLLTSANIEISINGNAPVLHTWTGNLGFMDETNVLIPVNAAFWTNATQARNEFSAKITGVNGQADQYVHNNEYKSYFEAVDTLPQQIRFLLRTNSAANQNSYTLKNSSGQVVFSRSGFANNTTYGDTITLAPGCYQLIFRDNGDDGLSFFANSAGNGYFRITQFNGQVLKNFNPDFGDGLEYYFTVDQTTGVEEISKTDFSVYPNPTSDLLNIQAPVNQYDWQMIDALGKTVLGGSVNQNVKLHQISMAELPKGIYFLRLAVAEQVLIKKVVKH